MAEKASSEATPRDQAAVADPAESLLRFKKAFDFKKFVRDHLLTSESNELAESVLASARLVGQEKDGGVLFAWDTADESKERTTHVGWYSPSSPTYRTLYRHEDKADICSASVNFERTLLAFTVKEDVGNTVMYDTFVAEIQPQGRVFTLNIGGNEFRKLQFLQPEVSTPRSRIGRHHQISRLLVVIPEVYICLYQFKLQLVRLGAVMVQQPDQEIITENFSWYQWDSSTQWLYYAKFESTSSPLQASISGRNSLVLNCVSFMSSSYQLLLTVSLPLPYNERLYSGASTYYHSPFAFTTPVREMNLQVLHRRDGFWCVCLQHCTGTIPPSDSNFEYEDIDTPQGGKIDYSVYIIHNGYVMYGQLPLPIPTNEDMHIHFMLMSCFVAAYIPGFMLHLLNVGPRTDPCHHLVFGPNQTPDFPIDTDSEEAISYHSPVLSSAVNMTLFGDHSAAVLETGSEIVYECELNLSHFFHLFKTCQNADLMEDLLHLMVIGFRHHGMALSMIEHVCQSPMRLVDHRLFAEFMISSTFANIHFDCRRYVAKQLPLTISPTFRGKVFKNSSGSKVALMKLTPMPNFIKQLLVQSDQKLVSATAEELLNYNPAADQPFELLCFIAVTSQQDIARVDIGALMTELEARTATLHSNTGGGSSQKPRQNKSRKAVPSPEPSSPSRGFINKISTLTRRTIVTRSLAPRSARNATDLLTFLSNDEDLVDFLDGHASAIRERLVTTISKSLPLRSKNVVYNAVTTYYSELEKQSNTLLLVIWQSLGFNMDNHPLSAPSPMSRQPNVKERIFFELLEAYHLAHLELAIPPPTGFHTLFICMGYLCLSPVVFLQYLRNGVFIPTRRFVDMLLETGSRNEPVVFQILCTLDFPLAEYAFQRWHNPTVEHLEASSHFER